jgi:2-polyprenyl-3-methyl-5-hydroxy-6-metoxy-1,4-benzoquinol methylase
MFPKCSLCGAGNYKEFSFYNSGIDFKIIKCANCGLSRIWPPPLIKNNAGLYYKEQTDYENRLTEIDLWVKFSSRILKIVGKYKIAGKFLDVGCNCGILVKEAIKRGYVAFGIDFSLKAIEAGGEKFNIKDRLFCGSIKDLDFKENSFDIITYIHVLEHIEGLSAELKDAYRILKPRGLLVIEVPNFESIWRKVLGNKWYAFSPFQHIWQFGPKSLKKIIENENFIIVKIYTQYSMYHKITHDIKGVFKLLLKIYSYIFNFGDNLIIVAVKI